MRACHLITLSLVSSAMVAAAPGLAQETSASSEAANPAVTSTAPEITYDEQPMIQSVGPDAPHRTMRRIERHAMHRPGGPQHPVIYPDASIGMGMPVYFVHGGYPLEAGMHPAQSEPADMGHGMESGHWQTGCDAREPITKCEAHGGGHGSSGQHANYYGYGPVMLVPVMVPVPQRAVVREYVTEEWFDEEVLVPGSDPVIIRKVPAQKRVKIVPGKSVKSVK